MTINDYFYMLKRYWGIILAAVIISTTAGIVAVQHASPVYEASGKLLIVDVNSGALLEQKDMILGSLGKSDPITTQVEVMRTRPIFEEVIRQCNIRDEDGMFLNPESFAKAFTIQAVRLSNIVTVSFKSGNPDSAANVVNTFAKVAEEQNQNLNREEVRNMRLFIEKQLDGQKSRLEEIEQASVSFKKKERTVAIDLQTSSQINTAADLESAVMKLEGERQGILAQQSELEVSLNVPRAQADPFYISKLNMYEQAKTRLSSLEAQKAALVRQLRSINYQLSSRPQEEVNLTRFLRDEKIAEKTYTDLLSKLQELEIKEAAKTASIKLIESAIPPRFPVSPNKKKSVAVALLMGFFFGCGVAYVIAYFKGHPYSIATIKSVLPYDILGTVPVVKKNERFFFGESLNAPRAESIRHIHTSLDFKGIHQSKHVNLLVTSASAGEGKSVICVNLACALAETGRRTALVNMNLRRNVFGTLLGPKTTNGVTDYLTGGVEIQDTCTRYPEYGFDIFDAGKTVDSPMRVFLRGRIGDFFTTLSDNYDICLFYSAPILTASETLDMSRYMNGIILVTDMAVSNTKSIIAMHELLEHKGLPVLGTVVNRMNSRV
jgi:tyrosine-protein kinase Etk/Wzc